MNNVFTFVVIFNLSYQFVFAQNIGIGAESPDTSAILELSHQHKGILIPRITESARLQIMHPANGLMVFQTSTTDNSSQGFYYFDNLKNSWIKVGGGGTAWEDEATKTKTIKKVVIENSTSNTLANNGALTLGPTISSNLSLDHSSIQARNDSTNHTLKLQEHGGNTDVGNALSSVIVLSQKETDLIENGGVVLGTVSEANLALDNNEIQARNNSTGNLLKIQKSGGNIEIGNDTSITIILSEVEAGLNTNGALIVGNETSLNLIFDNDEIQARNSGEESVLRLQKSGGNIHVSSDYESVVEILSTKEASLNSNGGLLLGPESSDNLTFDNNEIQARSNGTASKLYLQPHGGAVNVNGNLIINGQGSNVPLIAEETSGYAIRVGSTALGGSYINLYDNEILAQGYYGPKELVLQEDGNRTFFGGDLEIKGDLKNYFRYSIKNENVTLSTNGEHTISVDNNTFIKVLCSSGLCSSCSGSNCPDAVLTNGEANGHILILYGSGSSGNIYMPWDRENTTNYRLSANFQLTGNSIITLIWMESENTWYELSRSNNN